MVSSVVVEQQAKLGVPAEESKAQRLKRQQARFRDRGGAFVPSTSNPLVDILLARTVSGESPSKACPKNVPAKRRSSSKVRRASPAYRADVATGALRTQDVTGSSKSKPPASGKGNAIAVEPRADAAGRKPPSKRRAPTKGKKKPSGPDAEQPPLAITKSKSTSKRKGKRRTTPSTPDGNPKAKPQPRAKAKPNPAREIVEILLSDDDTLVEAPHKVKSNPKRSVRREDDSEFDDDIPTARTRIMPRVDGSKSSDTKTVKRVKMETIASTRKRKKTFEDEEGLMDEQFPRATAEKRPVSRGEQEVVAVPPAKKRKAATSTSAKPKAIIEDEPELSLRPTKVARKSENLKAKPKNKGKARSEPTQDTAEPVERDNSERPLERVSKPEKRKKDGNYDDRPRKVVKFSETLVSHSSSQKLKENQPDSKRAPKSDAKDESDVSRPKLATEQSSRANLQKGPPREVLERIKASAARHLRCTDSEPDELDCLS